ncbi:MAG: hypothetical protein IKX21_05880, partial [Deltaproteobacteria bacterium]|nr:hypothetical protein [Deltaproteobacteria bacterium]
MPVARLHARLDAGTMGKVAQIMRPENGNYSAADATAAQTQLQGDVKQLAEDAERTEAEISSYNREVERLRQELTEAARQKSGLNASLVSSQDTETSVSSYVNANLSLALRAAKALSQRQDADGNTYYDLDAAAEFLSRQHVQYQAQKVDAQQQAIDEAMRDTGMNVDPRASRTAQRRSMDPVFDSVYGRVDADSVAELFGAEVVADLRREMGPGFFAKKGEGERIDTLAENYLRGQYSGDGFMDADIDLNEIQKIMEEALMGNREYFERAKRGMFGSEEEQAAAQTETSSATAEAGVASQGESVPMEDTLPFWREVWGKVSPDDVQKQAGSGIYNELLLFHGRGLFAAKGKGQSIEKLSAKLQEQGLLQEGEDLVEKLRNMEEPTAELKRQIAGGQGGLFQMMQEAAQSQQEYDAVVAQYTNPDGTKKEGWMKAPNGQPTNLTERQWVQVRTPSFKKWFGDWEGAYFTRTWHDVENPQIFLDMPAREIGEIKPAANKTEIKKVFREFGDAVNENDKTVVYFPNETAGRMVYKKEYVRAFKQLFETSRRAWNEDETKFDGHKERRNIPEYKNYINKFKTSSGEYYVRFTVRQAIQDAP